MTAVESPWRIMEDAIDSVDSSVFVLGLFAVFVWAVWVLLLLTGRFDVGLLTLALLVLILANTVWALHRFCRGAMERIRQLSTAV